MCSVSRRFDYLPWPKAAKSAAVKGSTLVWPFGACEQHGPHLPLATDALFAEKILSEVLNVLPEEFPIWMLHTQNIGFSPEHKSFPGTLSLRGELLFQVVLDIGEQLSELGFSRLVFFNAHGGQIGLLQAVARQLRVNCPSMAVLPCFLWSGVKALDQLIPSPEKEEGLHAGLAETSLMLCLDKNLVGSERPIGGRQSFADLPPPPDGWSLEGSAPSAWLTQDLSENGTIGDSTEASAALGRDLKDALVAHWIRLFTSLMLSKWPFLEAEKRS